MAEPQPVKILIHVVTDGETAGTFTHPPARQSVLLNTKVHWETDQKSDDGQDFHFKVQFMGLSPFSSGAGGATPIADATEHTVDISGSYHYTVYVNDRKGRHWGLSNCPELDVT
jgi:hypothetical protein